MKYFSIVLFGKETKVSGLHHPDIFRSVSASLVHLFTASGRDLRVRGFVQGEKRRNMAPRRAKPSPKLTENYIDRMASHRFVNWELFDDSWSDSNPPDLYAGLTMLWHKNDPLGFSMLAQRTGAEHCLTLAVARDSVPAEQVQGVARGLFKLLGTFYGFVEPDVGWDRQRTAPGIGTCFGELMDTRWHEVVGVYEEGERMDTLVPGVFKGNILSQAHLRQSVDRVSAVADRVETWEGLHYIEFADDPQFDRQAFDACSPFFNAVPTSRMWRPWENKGWSLPGS